METININGIEYVKKDELNQNTEGSPFVCIGTHSAGVHFGYLKSRNGKEFELRETDLSVWDWDITRDTFNKYSYIVWDNEDSSFEAEGYDDDRFDTSYFKGQVYGRGVY